MSSAWNGLTDQKSAEASGFGACRSKVSFLLNPNPQFLGRGLPLPYPSPPPWAADLLTARSNPPPTRFAQVASKLAQVGSCWLHVGVCGPHASLVLAQIGPKTAPDRSTLANVGLNAPQVTPIVSRLGWNREAKTISSMSLA